MNANQQKSLKFDREIKRVAIWSGPRNVSTAMMRSWGNRPDTFPHDEPFYAHYLAHTGLTHPGADEVLRHHETNWREVVKQILGPIPPGKTIYYQKQMAHHLLPHFDRDWLLKLKNAFLIRNPKDMLLSLSQKLDQITIEDTGLPQQLEIFEHIRRETGTIPPVVDAEDVRNRPRETLSVLCASLEVPFSESMLHWPPGRRDTDGIWAKHWYASVEASTGFRPYVPAQEPLPEFLLPIYRECRRIYETLSVHRLCHSS